MSIHIIGYIQNAAYFLLLVLFSALITRFCRDYLRVMDVACARSSHTGVVPRSGGIALVMTFCIGITGYYALHSNYFIGQQSFWGLLLSAVIIAIVSFYDDVTNRALIYKVLSQLIGVAVLFGFGLTINELAIPFYGKVQFGLWSYPITLLWIIGITNAYNFMDGLNGLAAGVGVIVALSFSFITFTLGSKFVFHASYIIAAGCIGFLFFNYPRASIFLGDVGSTFLGFCFGSLAILAANYDKSHTPFIVIPVLLANFILETLYTFVWRLFKGRPVYKAHRTHPYQLLNRLGVPATIVTIIYYCQSILLLLLCVLCLRVRNDIEYILIMLTIIGSYSVYFIVIHYFTKVRHMFTKSVII